MAPAATAAVERLAEERPPALRAWRFPGAPLARLLLSVTRSISHPGRRRIHLRYRPTRHNARPLGWMDGGTIT